MFIPILFSVPFCFRVRTPYTGQTDRWADKGTGTTRIAAC